MDRPAIHRLARVAAIAASVGALSCVESRSRTASVPNPVPLPSPRRVSPEGQDPSDLVDRVIEAHNAERGRRGLPPLARNAELEAAADSHAREMARRRKMAHKGGDGSSPFDRIERAGYSFRAAAENVAYGFDDVPSVMSGWMHSRGHQRNILGNFEEIGVGRAIANDGASYWCVTFGTPRGVRNPPGDAPRVILPMRHDVPARPGRRRAGKDG